MKFLTFDTETTGLPRDRRGRIDDSSNWPYIVQLSWILYDNETNRLFKSNDIIGIDDSVEISKESIAVHGITLDFLADKPVFADVAEEFLAFISSDPLVIHNASFDMAFINAELIRIDRPVLSIDQAIDTLAICLLYTSPSPRDQRGSRMPSSG